MIVACICGGVLEGCAIYTFLAWILGLILRKKHKHNCKCCEKKEEQNGITDVNRT